MNKPKLIIIVIVFLLGLYFVTRKDIFEGFDKNRKHHRNKNKDNYRCPDVLIQKGKALFYLIQN